MDYYHREKKKWLSRIGYEKACSRWKISLCKLAWHLRILLVFYLTDSWTKIAVLVYSFGFCSFYRVLCPLSCKEVSVCMFTFSHTYVDICIYVNKYLSTSLKDLSPAAKPQSVMNWDFPELGHLCTILWRMVAFLNRNFDFIFYFLIYIGIHYYDREQQSGYLW